MSFALKKSPIMQAMLQVHALLRTNFAATLPSSLFEAIRMAVQKSESLQFGYICYFIAIILWLSHGLLDIAVSPAEEIQLLAVVDLL